MITTKVRNLKEISAMISSLPRNIRGGATKEAGIYLMGNQSRGLKHYPAQVPWSKYKRTFMYRFGFKLSGNGVGARIINSVSYAIYPRTRWAGSPWKWRTIPEVISANKAGMLRAIKLYVDRYIKSHTIR